MTTASPPERRSDAAGRASDRTWWLVATLVLLVLGAVLPLAIAWQGGALSIPRSDDWSYLTSLFRWTDGRGLDFNRWVSMTLVGQLVVAAPVALTAHHSIAAVRIEVALIGVGGLLATYWLGLQVIGRRGPALLIAATIALGPLWGPLAATYMTDVPTFTVQTVAAAVAIVGLRRPERRTAALIGAVALGFVGISIRQYAIVPVGAILVAYALVAWRTRDRRLLITVVATGAVVLVATAVLLLWWRGIPHPLTNAPMRPTLGSVREALARGIGYGRVAGLLLLPAVAWAGPIRIVRSAWDSSRALTCVLATAAALAMALASIGLGEESLVGNYIHPRGVLANDVMRDGARPFIMTSILWHGVVFAGSVSALVMMLAAVPWMRKLPMRLQACDLSSIDPISLLLGLIVIGYTVSYIVTDALQINQFAIFDRYALGMLPLIAALLLTAAKRNAPRSGLHGNTRAITVLATVVFLTMLGLTFSIDSVRFDAARWRLGEDIAAAGYPARSIYVSFEWNDWHDGIAPRRPNSSSARSRSWRRILADRCVIAVVNPPRLPPADRLVAKRRYASPLRRPVWIVAERNNRPCAIPPRTR